MVKINQKGNCATSYKIISHVNTKKINSPFIFIFIFHRTQFFFDPYKRRKEKLQFFEFLSVVIREHILATNHANNWYYSKSFSYPTFHVKICPVMLFGNAKRIQEKCNSTIVNFVL